MLTTIWLLVSLAIAIGLIMPTRWFWRRSKL